MKEKIENLLGLAIRAGKLITGEESCKKAIQSKQAYLIIVTEDASENTKKLFRDKTNYYHIPLRFYGTKVLIGKSVGKEARTAVAVMDKGFSDKLLEYLDTNQQIFRG